MPKIIIDQVRGIGHINMDRFRRAVDHGEKLCDDRLPAASRQECRTIVRKLMGDLLQAEGGSLLETSDKKKDDRGVLGRITGKQLAGLATGQLGVFQECALKCPEGWEKVVLRKPDPRPHPKNAERQRDLGVCVCRLAVSVRKKFTGDKYKKQTEEDRKPFGTEKKPVHLRRKSSRYKPGVIPGDIVPLR